MTKDELGDISGALKVEHGGEPQRLRKMLSLSFNLADRNKLINCIKSKAMIPKQL